MSSISSAKIASFIREAAVRRATRRVPDYVAADTAGIESLVTGSAYVHPLRSRTLTPAAAEGVLLTKPNIEITPKVISEIATRAGECGYRIGVARRLTGSVMANLQLANRHYFAHTAIARAGCLYAYEQARLLEIYGGEEFTLVAGRPAQEIAVMPVDMFSERFGVPLEIIDEWSLRSSARHGLNSGHIHGPNEVGDYMFVNLFGHPEFNGGEPVFLLNPHMPGMLARFAAPDATCFVFHLEAASPHAIPWSVMRREFCGSSDPERASPGSLRRDAWEGILPIGAKDGRRVSRAYNGFHLSNGAVEAMREICIWFGRTPCETETGRQFLAQGVSPDLLLDNAFIEHLGRPRVLAEITNGHDVATAATVVRSGRLLGALPPPSSPAVLSRVRVGFEVASSLARSPEVLAVAVSGSVARNRASVDSDVDLVVVTNADGATRELTATTVAGMTLELDRMSIAFVKKLLQGPTPSIQSLREASRIGLAVPLIDVGGIWGGFATTSEALQPPAALVRDGLVEALEELVLIVEQPERSAALQWERLRAVLDQLALLILLLHPLRYHKAKWVISDLGAIGEGCLRSHLLQAYDALVADRARIDALFLRVRCFLDEVAETCGLECYDETIGAGHLASHAGFSYACRTFADSQSLNADGLLSDAVYTAKCAARLGLTVASEHGSKCVPRVVEGYIAAVTSARQAEEPPDEATLEGILMIAERLRLRCAHIFTDPPENIEDDREL